MPTTETFYEVMRRQGITRRSFLKFCSVLASTMALPASMAPVMAEALAKARRQSVIWLSFQECTGCAESITRSYAPTLESLIFDFISLDYQHTLQAAAGHQVEEAREIAMKENWGKYLVIVDGSIPLKDDGIYSTIAGMTNLAMLKEVAAGAAAITASLFVASMYVLAAVTVAGAAYAALRWLDGARQGGRRCGDGGGDYG